MPTHNKFPQPSDKFLTLGAVPLLDMAQAQLASVLRGHHGGRGLRRVNGSDKKSALSCTVFVIVKSIVCTGRVMPARTNRQLIVWG